jgi:alkylhydroperoxidase family enzyme
MFAGTGDMFPATIGFVKALFQTAGIDPKTREIIALRCAKVLNCRYEWLANAVLAKNAGLLPEEIDAAPNSGPVTGIDSEYVLLCNATDELSTTGALTDETLSEMLSRFDETTCRKYVLMISWFNLLSRFLNGCRVPLETSDKIGGNTLPI